MKKIILIIIRYISICLLVIFISCQAEPGDPQEYPQEYLGDPQEVSNQPVITLSGATPNDGFTINNSNKIIFAFNRTLAAGDSELALMYLPSTTTFAVTKDGVPCPVDGMSACSGSFVIIPLSSPGSLMILNAGETSGTALFEVTIESQASIGSCDWQINPSTNADIQYVRGIPEITITCPAEVYSGQSGVILTGSANAVFEPETLSPAPTVVSYSWTQTGGPSVVLYGDTTPTAAFNAPVVTSDTDLTFQLEASDDVDSTPDTGDELSADLTVTITVKPMQN